MISAPGPAPEGPGAAPDNEAQIKPCIRTGSFSYALARARQTIKRAFRIKKGFSEMADRIKAL